MTGTGAAGGVAPAGGSAAPQHLVVMGVSGCGKTVLASLLAGRLDHRFCEADDIHPPANIEKMSRGVPLTDADRRPWLEALGAWMGRQAAEGRSTVMACSALRRDYRDILRSGTSGEVAFVHLDGDPELVMHRMNAREHFMPGSLLRSQLDTLEPLGPDELGVRIRLDQTPEEELAEVLAWLPARSA